MNSLIVLCLCVAYVAGQGVIVPPLSPENQQATEEHLAAVAKATQDHFAAHRDIPHEGAPRQQSFAPQQHQQSFAPQHHQQSFAPQQHQQAFAPQHQAFPFAPQQNAQPFAHQAGFGFNPHFNPHTFGQNRFQF